MKNTKIKYKLSTDYERLFKLLKEDNLIIGFIALDIDNVPSKEYSKVTQFSYDAASKIFDLGNCILFEYDLDKINFKNLCEEFNIRYFDLNTTDSL